MQQQAQESWAREKNGKNPQDSYSYAPFQKRVDGTLEFLVRNK